MTSSNGTVGGRAGPADRSALVDRDELPDRVWTLPNALSVLRLLGVPLFLWLLLGPRGGRLGAGRPDGLRVHRLAGRQAGPLAEPGQPARRAARPGRRPALHRLHARRAGHARRRPGVGGRPAARPRARARRHAAGAAPVRLPAAAGALPGQGGHAAAALRLPGPADRRRRRDRSPPSPSRSPGRSRSGARRSTCWPGCSTSSRSPASSGPSAGAASAPATP